MSASTYQACQKSWPISSALREASDSIDVNTMKQLGAEQKGSATSPTSFGNREYYIQKTQQAPKLSKLLKYKYIDPAQS